MLQKIPGEVIDHVILCFLWKRPRGTRFQLTVYPPFPLDASAP